MDGHGRDPQGDSVPMTTLNPVTRIERPSCEDQVPLDALERHLTAAHGFPRHTAARVAAEERAARAPRVLRPAPKETRPSKAPLPAHAGRSHRANPAACLTCAKFAPAKCRRHGGPIRSTSYRGQGEAGAFAIAVREYKRELVCEALRASGGHRTRAAEALGIRLSYLWRLMQSLGMTEPTANGA